ncbi:polyprenyl diphosphate synthase [Candidatus Pelagibacter ubique]|jgi:undecaprenyl diphosphate synthase|nr:polyprenyl diphosphate synthase [Candidatus Pelagibacter bacterium]MDA8841569.1 polyprenyl diphosphate synthase [Candidatus Pelagibacter bacterium]MDC0951590.1 polyprenyl diphosphate synthase [Candidatus Pelagibacter ubique]
MNPIKHVAIIMDGNGRWGIKHKNSRNAGHREGLNTVESIINECLKINIKYLTLYTFSTENWKRPKKEINFLFNLLENFLTNKIDNLLKKNIKLKFIGEINKLPIRLRKIIKNSELKTSKNSSLQVNVALNYGSKSELINSIKNIRKKKIKINEKNIDNNLFTKNIIDPDILIRTGNTQRLSNFMLWQLAYTEIFFEKKLWPDFKSNDFKKILNKFKSIKRNFGSI